MRLSKRGWVTVSLTDKLSNLEFWTRRYDGIILCIGGNDLARLSVDEVFNRLYVTYVGDSEPRLHSLLSALLNIDYPRQNRLRVDQETYRRKVVLINRKIKRFTRSINAKIVDLGRRCFTLKRVGDGVHFTLGGQNNLCRTLNNVIRAFVHRSSL